MGQVNNWGIEVNLNTTNIQTKDFNWGSTLTFYMNRNKLKELYGDGQDDITNSLFLGKSLGAIYGYKNIGIVQEEDTEYMAANGAEPGDVKFANLDGSEDGSLSYTFRQPWVQKAGIGNLKVYMACKNLFTISGWEGGDPEVQQTLGSGYTYGYPLSRTVSFGLNLTF